MSESQRLGSLSGAAWTVTSETIARTEPKRSRVTDLIESPHLRVVMAGRPGTKWRANRPSMNSAVTSRPRKGLFWNSNLRVHGWLRHPLLRSGLPGQDGLGGSRKSLQSQLALQINE